MVRRMKGVSPLIAGIIYTLIVLVAITITLSFVLPEIEKMKDRVAFENAKSMMRKLDEAIREVVSEGTYSSRIVTISLDRGNLIVYNGTGKIEYRLESTADIVSPGVERKLGNIIIAGGDDVTVEEKDGKIIMRNSYLEVNFTRLGNTSYYVPVNVSRVIESVKLLRENTTIYPEMSIKLADIDSGNGYVVPVQTGEKLAKGEVVVHIVHNKLSFDIYFILKSYADFLIIEAKNVKILQ